MAGETCRGPLGCETNRPEIDAGTLSCTQNSPPGCVGAQLWAVEISPLEQKRRQTVEWFSELNEALGMGVWWLVGSPAMGAPNGDLLFGPGDDATMHMRNTAAYQEAVEIFKDWINDGRPMGKLKINDTNCEYVSRGGYFYVEGRSGAGRSQRGHWYEPLQHPLWGFTGTFSIQFTETGYPKEGYVSVKIENYTSLPSYLHGIDVRNPTLESLYTKRSGVPILSRSRQVYKFLEYISPAPPAASENAAAGDTTYKVVAGDSLSGLAKAYYGEMDLWPIILEKNQRTIGTDPNQIKVGTLLVIPAKHKLTAEQIEQAKQSARLFRRGPVQVTPPR